MSLIPYIGVVYRHKINEIEIQNEFATPPKKKYQTKKTSNKKKNAYQAINGQSFTLIL